MFLLSIETTSRNVSVAAVENTSILVECLWRSEDPGKEILATIDFVLKKTCLPISCFERIVVSTGPGSWTGIRLGLGLALGLAKGDDKYIYGLSSLDGLIFRLGNFRSAGGAISGAGSNFHYIKYPDMQTLIQHPVPPLTGDRKKTQSFLGSCRIVACSKDTATLLKWQKKSPCVIGLDVSAGANALLARERIILGVKPHNTPDYEK
jgi:tRNA threonylcarbamoyl adenosine modification protein YeaZ